MKHKKLFLLIAIAFTSFFIVACEQLSFDQTEEYNITFNTHCDLIVQSQIVKEGKTVILPEVIERDGYTFIGWYYNNKQWDFSTPVTSDLELEAIWKADCRVTFITNCDSYVHSQLVKYGQTATEPRTMERDEYTFLGWYYNNIQWDFAEPVTSDMELEALWQEPYTEGLKFEKADNAYIVSAGDALEEEVIQIPEFYLGKPVIAISTDGFKDCANLKEINIPSSIEYIGANAFTFCNILQKVTIQDLSSWCRISFGNSSSNPVAHSGRLYIDDEQISDLVIPSDINKINDYAFYHCYTLRTITFHSGIQSIGTKAFYTCFNLTSLQVPNSVKQIGEAAFGGCYQLQKIELPFVGDKRHQADDLYQYPFGYIFGTTRISNCEETIQYYYASSGSAGVSGKYYIPTSLKEVVITNCSYISRGAFEGCKNLTTIVVPDTVTIIGNSAFKNCENLTSFTVPTGVTEIEMYAFQNCYALESISIPRNVAKIGNSAFAECSSLASVTLPNNITVIYDDSFKNCTSLTSINIPSNVTYFGRNAFMGCINLTNVTLANGLTNLGIGAFSGCKSITSITIPSSMTRVNDMAFSGCSGMTSLTISNGVTTIGRGAFSGCHGLTSLTIPDSVKTLESDAFSSCQGLTSISIHAGITSIAKEAFNNCQNITSFVVDENNPNYDSRNNCNALIETATNTLFFGCQNTIIPDDITTIAAQAFVGCQSLTKITIPESVTSIGDKAFSGCRIQEATVPGIACGYIPLTVLQKIVITSGTSIPENAFSNARYLTSVTLPDTITSIGKYAFSGCIALPEITIPSGVTIIEEATFTGCSLLETVILPSNLTKIDKSAFTGCGSLKNITIPSSTTFIGESAFNHCSNLETIRIPISVEIIRTDAFTSCDRLTIYCEVSSRPESWSANWNASNRPVIWDAE